MMNVGHYASGADVEVYLTDSSVLPTRFENPLNVQGISIVQEGEVLPLYQWSDAITRHFAYATQLITGSLDFNYKKDTLQPLRPIHGKTLWAIVTKVVWWNSAGEAPSLVRDYIRMDHVWEHPFQHQPDPSAVESLPFTARSLALVKRESAPIDINKALIALADEQDAPAQFGEDWMRSSRTEYVGRIVRVWDGDTYDVTWDLDSNRTVFRVRLIGVDTPEKAGSTLKQNKDNDPAWRWPEGAPPNANPLMGAPKQSPTAAQLGLWGEQISAEARAMLPEGTGILLTADPGSAAADDPEFDPLNPNTNPGEGGDKTRRYLFHVKKLSDNTDMAEWLLSNGYANPFYSTSIVYEGDGVYVNRMAQLDRTYRQARALAGTGGAKGVWSRFQPE